MQLKNNEATGGTLSMKMPHPFFHTGTKGARLCGREPGNCAGKVKLRASCSRCVGNEAVPD